MNDRMRLLLIPIVVTVSSFAVAAERPPNIILFLVDDMGWTDGGVFGSDFYETPHVDAFAKQAMRFTNAYAHPLCSPSRASILTGQEESRHGILSAHGHQEPEPWGPQVFQAATSKMEYRLPKSRRYLDPKAVTLAEAYQSAGYRTAHLGKWHLGLTQEHWPDKHGFGFTFHAAPDPGPPGSTYFSPHGVQPNGYPTSGHRVGNIVDGPDGEHIDDRLGTEAIEFISRHKDVPFYLNLWMYDCHGPWEAKLDSIKDFAKKESNQAGHTNPVYAAMLKTMDDNFGRVMAAVEDFGVAENTIVIFFSDNGGNTHSMGETDQKRSLSNPKLRGHGYTKVYNQYAGIQHPTKNLGLRAGKGRLYEGGARVPLMVRWPDRIPAGSTSDAIVNNIDLYPTLLDLTNHPKPEGHIIDGESFARVLTEGEAGDGRTTVSFFPYHNAGISVRDGDWKLIRRFVRKPDQFDGLVELFNLRDDLGETCNLASEMPEKVAELGKLVDAHFVKTGGLVPELNPDFQKTVTTNPMRKNAIQGLVPRQCRIDRIDGGIRVVPDGKTPFLGTAQVRATGPIALQFRARTVGGKTGEGRIQWRTDQQDSFPESAQTVDFRIPSGAQWQEIAVQVPVKGRSQLMRIHLPTDDPIEIQSIRWLANGHTTVEWDFTDQSNRSVE